MYGPDFGVNPFRRIEERIHKRCNNRIKSSGRNNCLMNIITTNTNTHFTP